MPWIPCPLHQAALAHGDAPAVVGPSGVMGWEALDRAADAAAFRLRREAGLRPGDRVAILAANPGHWFPLLFGLFRLGILACPLHARLPPSQLAQRLRDVHANALVTDGPFPGLDPGIPALDLAGTVAPLETAAPSTPLDSSRPAILLHTSGSMGHAKAIVHSLHAHLASARGANPWLAYGAGDRWLLSLPLYHVGGLGILFRTVLAGATLVVPAPRAELPETLETHGVTHLSLVPTQLERLLRHPDRSRAVGTLKLVLVGGAPVPRDLLHRAWDAGLPARASWGMTETASLVTLAPLEAAADNRESDGIVLPARELRVSPDGELWVRGDILPLGRWRDGKIESMTDAEGWLHTGDLGDLRDGVLRVAGRRDNQFISGGENIQPEEIERVLLEVTGARQAVVTPRPDAEFGQRPLAWLDLSPDQIRPGEWQDALRARLPGYMMPVAYRSLPPEEGLKPDRPRLIRAGRMDAENGNGRNHGREDGRHGPSGLCP